ncbi:hypothetical protein [Candidatus Mycoplasma haematohominis]|uniref:hypothetical protein n=1 Tax=Candidatus Mycoplasma haematohominis TaxID=1494318 RepID=UPI001C0A71BA|nr:hypothetical protein [Candidatus Mycoplasma haemohominis]
MSIFSTIVKAVTATGVVSGAAGVGSKMYLKNGHGFGTMDVNATSNTTGSNTATPTNSESPSSKNTSANTQDQPVTDTTKTTYGSELVRNKYKLVDSNTEEAVLLNIMMERLDPTKDKLKYEENKRFSVSPEIEFGFKEFKSSLDGKEYSTTVLQKPDSKYVDPWRQACIQALAVEVTEAQWKDTSSNEGKEMARLREWCTIPTVEQVLKRHKLTPLNTDESKNTDDEKWREVIAGGWFKKEGSKKNWEDQSFIKDSSDLTIVVGTGEVGVQSKESVTTEQINVFKKRCKAELSRDFTRDNFYLTTQFINGIKDNKPVIDPFQEAALFCVQPFTASEYITTSLQGLVSSNIEVKSDDYCYLTDINQKDSWTTNNPIGGKSFWCAVRALYKAKTK